MRIRIDEIHNGWVVETTNYKPVYFKAFKEVLEYLEKNIER